MARLGSLLGLKVVHLVIESGVPAGMPVLSIPTTVHYAAGDRFWDGYVCCALWPGCGQLLHCCLLKESVSVLAAVPKLQVDPAWAISCGETKLSRGMAVVAYWRWVCYSCVL